MLLAPTTTNPRKRLPKRVRSSGAANPSGRETLEQDSGYDAWKSEQAGQGKNTKRSSCLDHPLHQLSEGPRFRAPLTASEADRSRRHDTKRNPPVAPRPNL